MTIADIYFIYIQIEISLRPREATPRLAGESNLTFHVRFANSFNGHFKANNRRINFHVALFLRRLNLLSDEIFLTRVVRTPKHATLNSIVQTEDDTAIPSSLVSNYRRFVSAEINQFHGCFTLCIRPFGLHFHFNLCSNSSVRTFQLSLFMLCNHVLVMPIEFEF